MNARNGRVTITIGFACRDLIVFAADSQITYPDGKKVKNVKKIHAIEAKNGTALLAFSNYVDPANRYIDIFRELVAGRSIKSKRDFAEWAGEAARIHQQERLKTWKENGLTKKQRDERFHAETYSITLAYYDSANPLFYRLNSVDRVAIHEKTRFVSDGIPLALAQFAVAGIDLKSIQTRAAFSLAAYLVHLCIEFDSSCDRPIKIGYLAPNDDFLETLTPMMEDAYHEAARMASEEMKHELADRLTIISTPTLFKN